MRTTARSVSILTGSLTTLLLCGGPATTGASADGFERAPPCHYYGPGAIFPQNAEFTTVPGTPYIPPGREFTDSEEEPTDDFTATANWGDGTTSPATVSLPPGGCYEVTGPSHTYASPGTYSFSYTVHDAHTGLDHTVGSELLYIVSVLPHPVFTPSTRLIQTITGKTWTGVVGEFAYWRGYISLAAYATSIDWGDGQRSPGTIAATGLTSFTVSGSHAYASQTTTPIAVTVTGGVETGTWITANLAASEAPPPVRFLHQPILSATRPARGATVYEVIFRLDRPLPRSSSGGIEASLGTRGSTSPLRAFGRLPNRACYSAHIAASAASVSARLPITLTVEQPAPSAVSATARLVRSPSAASTDRAARRRLGC